MDGVARRGTNGVTAALVGEELVAVRAGGRAARRLDRRATSAGGEQWDHQEQGQAAYEPHRMFPVWPSE